MSSPSPSPPPPPKKRASPTKTFSERANPKVLDSPGARDNTSARVINGLKYLYHEKLKKFEERFYFSNFHYSAISDAEIEAKPQVLLIGQYSTGKTSFISHLLGKPYPQAHIGPEPTTDKFIAVVHGKTEKVIKGNSLTVVPELPFGGLAGFGAAFLNKFEASVCPAELLESVTIIDSPGVLSGEKQRISRSYSFSEVVTWFAERSDLILLLFDAHKLDISDEFREVIEALKPHDDKVRCVLNKADQIEKDQFVRVYGSLLWSMGKIFQTPEVIRVYCGSYWKQPLVHDDYKSMFTADEKLLTEELKNLPSSAAARKINDMVKRIRLVKVHVCILSYLKSQMPLLWGKQAKQEFLMKNLDLVFEEVKAMYLLSDGDMPPIETFRANLRTFNFRMFPSLDRRVIRELDELIAKEIPALMGRVGGVSGVLSMSSMLEVEHSDTATELLKKKQVQAVKAREDAKRMLGGATAGDYTIVLVAAGLLVVGMLVLLLLVLLSAQGMLQGPLADAINRQIAGVVRAVGGGAKQAAAVEETAGAAEL